ncbi:MAG: hypothetical protein AABX05_03150 [Nanoarchaeota archaeon]
MVTYDIELDRSFLVIEAKPSRYKLLVNVEVNVEPRSTNDYWPVFFSTKDKNDHWVLITGRKISSYDQKVRELQIDPSLQYLEIGAGMGELTPHIVKHQPLKKPIVIDPANYLLMMDMLKFAYQLHIDKQLKEKISILHKRCRVITDPDKVNLINGPLEEALSQHPELEGIADVVIDNYGAVLYSGLWASQHQQTITLEKKLLKSDGVHIYH